MAAWTCLEETPARRRYYAGATELELYPRETDTLKFNIEGPALRSTCFFAGICTRRA
jgi:hypothetical protein